MVIVVPVVDRPEVMPVSIDQKDLKHGYHQGQPDSLRIHCDVEEQNHHNDGSKDREGHADVAVDQQQNASDEIKDTDKDKPAVFEQKPGKDPGVSRWWWHGYEMKKRIHAERGEYKAKQDASDNDCDLHEQFSFGMN
jgi:hypothetical protein